MIKDNPNAGKKWVGGVYDLPQFFPAVTSFNTVNPTGQNSEYTKLPDGRWARDKKATGTLHTAQTTKFVHPDYSKPVPHPTLKGKTYNRLEAAASTDELVGKGGEIGFYEFGGAPGKGKRSVVPTEHISDTPKEGWTPVEYSLHDTGDVKKYHLGHPIAPFTKANFR